MTDWELITKYTQTQSGEAFAELAKRHVDMVYATALREVRDPELAQDVTQGVFMVLMQKASTLSAKVVIGGWLFQVTRYACADARKKQLRRNRHENEAGKMRLNAPDAGENELSEQVDEAISRLGKSDRDGIVLKYLEGRTYGEVAAAMGTSEDGARKRLSRALAKLRAMLTKRGASADEATLGVMFAARLAVKAPLSVLVNVQTLAAGSSGSSASGILAKEVVHMMKLQKIKLITGIVAAAVLLATGVTLTLMETQWVSGAEAASTILAPASEVPMHPRVAGSPKDVVVQAFHLALEGDADQFVLCFTGLSPEQELSMRDYVSAAAAYNTLMESVGKKFGKEAQAKFAHQLMGVDPVDVEKGTEVVDGDTAVVDLGKSGPGRVPLVKVKGEWKISPEVFKTFNSQFAKIMAGKIGKFRQLAKDVDAGVFVKVENLEEKVGQVVQEVPARNDLP